MRNQREHVLVHRSQPFFWKRPESKYFRLPKSDKLCPTTQLCPGAQKQSWWRRNGHGQVPIKLPTEIGGGPNLALGLQCASPCAHRVCIYLEGGTETKLPQVTPGSHFPRPGSPHAWPLSFRILTPASWGQLGLVSTTPLLQVQATVLADTCSSDYVMSVGLSHPFGSTRRIGILPGLFSWGPQHPAQDLTSSESLLTK